MQFNAIYFYSTYIFVNIYEEIIGIPKSKEREKKNASRYVF